jgi:hypothetical protein
MQRSTRFVKEQVLAALLAGSCLSGQALAAIVYTGPVSIPIPDSIDGIYLNVVNGASGASGGTVPGWDINPYTASAGTFNLWGPTIATWLSTGGIIAGPYKLAPGTQIDPAGTYFRPGGSSNVAPEVTLNSDQNLFGFRFFNEDNGDLVHYGWLRIAFGASVGARTIVEIAYEDQAGQPIAAGDTGLPPDLIFVDGFEL